jgi:hypothetical protein
LVPLASKTDRIDVAIVGHAVSVPLPRITGGGDLQQ